MRKIAEKIVWLLSKITFGAIPVMKSKNGPDTPPVKPPGSGG
jgi:hypothetical protein